MLSEEKCGPPQCNRAIGTTDTEIAAGATGGFLNYISSLVTSQENSPSATPRGLPSPSSPFHGPVYPHAKTPLLS